MSHSVWLTRFAEAVGLLYEDIAELARRWKRNEPVTSIEVAAVLSPVLHELLEAQQRFTVEEIFEIQKNLRDIAKSQHRHTLCEDFDKFLRGGRSLSRNERRLPETIRRKLGRGERLSIEEIDLSQLWAIEHLKYLESGSSEIREQIVERWRRCLSSRMFPPPHHAIDNPERLLRHIAKKTWCDRRRTRRQREVSLASFELTRIAPCASPVADEREYELECARLSSAIESVLRRLRKRDRSLWRGRNPGRVSLMLDAAKKHIEGQSSELGAAVCAQLSAGLHGRRGKRGSLLIIERELSRKSRAMAVQPGTMRRTLKKLRHAVMTAVHEGPKVGTERENQ